MDMVSSIANLSISQSTAKLSNDIGTAILAKTLEGAKAEGAAQIKLIESMSPQIPTTEIGGLMDFRV